LGGPVRGFKTRPGGTSWFRRGGFVLLSGHRAIVARAGRRTESGSLIYEPYQ
jgi:hypothetical protein